MIECTVLAFVIAPAAVVGLGYVAVLLQERETERLKQRPEEGWA